MGPPFTCGGRWWRCKDRRGIHPRSPSEPLIHHFISSNTLTQCSSPLATREHLFRTTTTHYGVTFRGNPTNQSCSACPDLQHIQRWALHSLVVVGGGGVKIGVKSTLGAPRNPSEPVRPPLAAPRSTQRAIIPCRSGRGPWESACGADMMVIVMCGMFVSEPWLSELSELSVSYRSYSIE